MVDVEKLLAAIAEAERLAHEAAQVRSWWNRKPIGSAWEDAGGNVLDSNDAALWDDAGSDSHRMPDAASAFIAHNDPAAVLQRCAADRRLIERYQFHENRYRNRVEASHTNRACRIDVYFAVCVMIQHVAAGYGLSVDEEVHGG